MTPDHREPPPGAPHAPSPPRRRHRLRTAAIALVALLGLLAAAPWAGSVFVRRQLESRIEARYRVEVEVERVHVGLGGRVDVVGLVVEHLDGRPLAHADRAELRVAVLETLRGAPRGSARIDGLHLDVERAEDGRWSLEGLERASAPGEGDGENDEGAAPSDVTLALEVAGASVAVRGGGTALMVEDVTAVGDLTGTGVALRTTGRIPGATGDAARWRGELASRIDAPLRADLTLDALDLGLAAEIARLVGSPLPNGATLAGRATGALAATVDAGAGEVTLRLEGRDVHVDSGGDEALLQLDEVRATLDGTLHLASDASGALEPRDLAARLVARGGKLEVLVGWDAADTERGAFVELRGDRLEGTALFEPLLARVHPVFHHSRLTREARASGALTSNVELSWVGPCSLADLARLADPARAPLRGSATFSVDGALVRGSPLVAQLLQALGEPGEAPLQIAPLTLNVADGVVRYAAPWPWKIGAVGTAFEGGVGLDGTLALAWVVPVDASLAARSPVLRRLEGRALRVPLEGTLAAPRIDFLGAVQDLAGDALKGELEQRANDELGRLIDRIWKR